MKLRKVFSKSADTQPHADTLLFLCVGLLPPFLGLLFISESIWDDQGCETFACFPGIAGRLPANYSQASLAASMPDSHFLGTFLSAHECELACLQLKVRSLCTRPKSTALCVLRRSRC